MSTIQELEQRNYQPNNGSNFSYNDMLPCPFCGEIPKLTFIGNDYTKQRKVIIKCPKCRITLVNAGRITDSIQLAKWSIDRWNNRIPCSNDNKITELEQRIKELEDPFYRAPEWAEYFAVDANGLGYCFYEYPTPNFKLGVYQQDGSGNYLAVGYYPELAGDWMNSLRRRVR